MKTVFTLLISVFAFPVFSQSLPCGNPDESAASEAQRQQQIAQIKTSPGFLQRNVNVTTYIALKMHLFGEDDDSGYADDNAVNDALAKLNAEFQPFGVEFYFSGTDFNQYPNSQFNQGNQTFEEGQDFHNTFGVDNAINVYVAQSVVLNGSNVGGWSYLSPSSQLYNRMFIVTGQLDDFKTTPHEFGHYFGLSHTFNSSDSDDISARELVTRNFNEPLPRLSANCDINGDFVCDTPSDPYNLPGYSDSDCIYNGTDLDANSDPFAPDLYNFMGYNWCGPQVFSSGQYDKMTDGLAIVNNPFNDFLPNAPETVQPAPSNLVAANSNGDYFGDVTLSWADNSNVETGYIIESSTSASGPFKAVFGVGPNVTSTSGVPADANQTYYFRIKPSNSINNYSAVSNAITLPSLCGNAYGQTCEVNVDPSAPHWRIERFTLSSGATTLIDNVASGCSENGIGNYYNTLSAQVIPGEALTFNVQSKADSQDGSAYTIIANLYADWNNDGDFDDANESLFAGSPSFYQVSSVFNVPAGQPNGSYRLRVVITASETPPTACGYWFGEVEDYRLTIGTLTNQEWDSNTLVIAPNPARSILEIQSNISPDRLVITDMTGKIVLEQHSDTKRANVEKLASGMYIIQAFSGDEKFQTKFVKE